MFNSIQNTITEKLIGHACFVNDDNGNMAMCEITRVDIYISSSGIGVNLHLKRNGNQNFPHCVNMYGYRSSNQSTLPYGFTNIEDYNKFNNS